MTPTQWKTLQEIFDDAVSLPKSQRQQFVEQRCKGQQELLTTLLNMLAQDDNNSQAITHLIAHSVERVFCTDSLIGKRVGSFELTQRIGVGGMGEVYRAIRSDGEFEQQVAVKIIKPSYYNESINAQFKAERQMLARLTHPNIARVIDGGRFDGDKLYLVMEYIQGLAIDDYCRQNTFNQNQKLTLFLTVCSAVSSAHQNRVIHCDIKPSNILVNDNAQPYLLDFGIATLIDANEDDSALLSSTDTVNAITWDYASPEQQAGESLSTATDIYALGLLLFKLLVDERAHIVDKRITSQSLDALIQQDLKMIITKALHPCPNERYSSVDLFACDIESLLNTTPISLRLSERKYTLTRFLQRNTMASLLTCFSVVLIIALGIREHQLRNVAQAAQIKAQHESQKAHQVTAFLTDIFKVADPNHNKGADITAREILTRGRHSISDNLHDQPALHYQLLTTIGTIYENMGWYEDAKSVYIEAIAIADVEFDSDSDSDSLLRIETLSRLGFVYIQLSQLTQADKVLAQALNNKLAPSDPIFASIYNHFGLLRHEQGKFNDAIQYYLNALALRQQHSATEHVQYFRLQHNLANTYAQAGQYEQAEQLFKLVLDAKERLLGKLHQSYIRSLTSYVNLAKYRGTNEQTLPLALEVVSLAQTVLKEDHPDLLNGLNTVANVLHDQGKFKQARGYYQRLLVLDNKYSGKESIAYSVTLNNLAYLYMDMNDFEQAEPLFRESLALRKKLYGAGNPRITSAMNNLSKLLTKMKRYQEAAIINQQALDSDPSNRTTQLPST